MKQLSSEDPEAFYAQTYDVCVSDWPGEIDFYRQLVSRAGLDRLPVLEVACGTGRAAIRLAGEGARVVGLDKSTIQNILTAKDQRSCLKSIKRHLIPGGLSFGGGLREFLQAGINGRSGGNDLGSEEIGRIQSSAVNV